MNDTQVTRRSFLGVALAGAVAGGIAAADQATSPVPPFDLGEATVADLQAAMAVGRITSKTIMAKYLERIDALDRRGPALRHVIETNPDALKIAEALDEERSAKGQRGPLHGSRTIASTTRLSVAGRRWKRSGMGCCWRV